MAYPAAGSAFPDKNESAAFLLPGGSMTTETRNVSDIVWREDLYPRSVKSPETVQKYAADLSVLPPIEVNQNGRIDRRLASLDGT